MHRLLSYIKQWVPIDHPSRTLFHRCVGWIAALRFGFPGRRIPIVGITGTDGKTTTVFLTTQLLGLLGKKVGMASTVGFRIGDTYWPNTTHKTSMGRFGLQRLLSRFVHEDCDIGVVEVSSHGLVQGRLTALNIVTALITNLSREHLDYHRTMERYRDAKGLLFKKLRFGKGSTTSVVFQDFPYSDYYLSFPATQKITYGSTKGATLHLKEVVQEERGQSFCFEFEGQLYHAQTHLEGVFNIYNILAAVSVCLGQGYAVADILPHIPVLESVPGRMEHIFGKTCRIVIDYAVTPDALRTLYTSLKPLGNRLVAVLGACGDRDRGKRPEMGKIAATLCDYVYFTDEEPYTENPRTIIDMLVRGAKTVSQEQSPNFEVIEQRREAIRKAISTAQNGDVIVISGMGDQTSRIVGDKKEPWSDRGEVESALHTYSV